MGDDDDEMAARSGSDASDVNDNDAEDNDNPVPSKRARRALDYLDLEAICVDAALHQDPSTQHTSSSLRTDDSMRDFLNDASSLSTCTPPTQKRLRRMSEIEERTGESSQSTQEVVSGPDTCPSQTEPQLDLVSAPAHVTDASSSSEVCGNENKSASLSDPSNVPSQEFPLNVAQGGLVSGPSPSEMSNASMSTPSNLVSSTTTTPSESSPVRAPVSGSAIPRLSPSAHRAKHGVCMPNCASVAAGQICMVNTSGKLWRSPVDQNLYQGSGVPALLESTYKTGTEVLEVRLKSAEDSHLQFSGKSQTVPAISACRNYEHVLDSQGDRFLIMGMCLQSGSSFGMAVHFTGQPRPIVAGDAFWLPNALGSKMGRELLVVGLVRKKQGPWSFLFLPDWNSLIPMQYQHNIRVASMIMWFRNMTSLGWTHKGRHNSDKETQTPRVDAAYDTLTVLDARLSKEDRAPFSPFVVNTDFHTPSEPTRSSTTTKDDAKPKPAPTTSVPKQRTATTTATTTTTKRRGRMVATSSDDDAAPIPPPLSSSSATGLATKHNAVVEDLRAKLADSKLSIKELQKEIAATKAEKGKAHQRVTDHEKQIEKVRASADTEIERMRQLIREHASAHATELQSQRVEADTLLRQSEASASKRVATLEAQLQAQAFEQIEINKHATERESTAVLNALEKASRSHAQHIESVTQRHVNDIASLNTLIESNVATHQSSQSTLQDQLMSTQAAIVPLTIAKEGLERRVQTLENLQVVLLEDNQRWKNLATNTSRIGQYESQTGLSALPSAPTPASRTELTTSPEAIQMALRLILGSGIGAISSVPNPPS